MESALLNWYKTFPFVGSDDSIDDFVDGNLLSRILSEIDHEWFKADIFLPSSLTYNDSNPMLLQSRLKTLFRTICHYLESCLGHDTTTLTREYTKFSKNSHSESTLFLCRVILALAVQSKNQLVYIEKIQSLDQSSQHDLMVMIESIISTLRSNEGQSASEQEPAADSYPLITQKYEETIGILAAKNAELEENARLLREEFTKMEEKFKKAEKEAQIELSLKAEIISLKQKLDDMEIRNSELIYQVNEKEKLAQSQKSKILESERLIVASNQLKDQLDEYQNMSDKLKKSEALVEQLRKKIDQDIESRKSAKNTFEDHEELLKRNQYLELEFSKLAATNEQLLSTRQRIIEIDSLNEKLSNELQSLADAKAEIEIRLHNTESEKTHYQELVHELEGKFQNEGFREGNISTIENQFAKDDEIMRLQMALKKAKEYILSQDQKIKELKSNTAMGDNPYEEVVETLRFSLETKEKEIESLKSELHALLESSAKEQRLVLSSWLEMSLQRRRTSSKSSWLDSQRKRFLGNY